MIIIINSDHGSRSPVFNKQSGHEIGGRNFEQTVEAALPLLIVKQAGGSGPLWDS